MYENEGAAYFLFDLYSIIVQENNLNEDKHYNLLEHWFLGITEMLSIWKFRIHLLAPSLKHLI